MRSYRACLKAGSGSQATIRTSCRHLGTTAVVSNKTQPGYVDEKLSHSKTGLDPDTVGLLDDMHLGMGAGHRSVRRKRPLIYGDDLPGNDNAKAGSLRDDRRQAQDDDKDTEVLARDMLSESEELEALDNVAKYVGDEMFGVMAGGEVDSGLDYEREDRLSPAAAFGSKRVGMVVIPEELNNAIQTRVDGQSAYILTCLPSSPLITLPQ